MIVLRDKNPGAMEVHELTDGGQSAEQVAALRRRRSCAARAAHARAGALRHPAARARPGDAGRRRAARGRRAAGCEVRLLYNVDSARPPAIQPPPSTRPGAAAELPIDDRAGARDPGPDAPQVRGPRPRGGLDRLGELDDDSWTRQENVLVAIDSAPLGARLRRELRRALGAPRRRAQRPRRAGAGSSSTAGRTARAWFTPGHGTELSQAIATAIALRAAAGADRLAGDHLGADPRARWPSSATGGGVDVAGVIDEPQTDAVYGQWATNGGLGLEDPAAGEGAQPAAVLGQALDAVGARHRPRLHARQGHGRRRHRLRRLVQPLALGRDERRERARAPRPRARRADGGVRRRGPRALPARRRCPAQAMRDDLRRSRRRRSAISKSSGEIRPGVEQLGAHPVEQPRPVVACRRGRPGGRSPRRSGSGSCTSNSSSSVP